MDLLLQNRASTGGMYRADLHQTQRPFGVSIAFLGLLFAMLASGCQSSDLPSKERELTSQVYGMAPLSFSLCFQETETNLNQFAARINA